jgi:hypothetical protein
VSFALSKSLSALAVIGGSVTALLSVLKLRVRRRNLLRLDAINKADKAAQTMRVECTIIGVVYK